MMGVGQALSVPIVDPSRYQKPLMGAVGKKFVLSRSFLNFLRIFCKLKEQFIQVWENFAPPPGIRPSFFAPGQGIRQKNCLGGRDSLAPKNFPGGCPGRCTQLELTETLPLKQKTFS